MQIMTRTFDEIGRNYPRINGNRLQPRRNIAAGIFLRPADTVKKP